MTNHKHHSTTNAECHIAEPAYVALRDPALMSLKTGVGEGRNGGKLTVDRRAAARRNALSNSRRAYEQFVHGDNHSVSRRFPGPWGFVYKVILGESAPSADHRQRFAPTVQLEAHTVGTTASTHCVSGNH